MTYYDVIIAGAGPAGSHLAQLLSKKGLSVLVLEKKKIPGKSACSGLISTRLKTIIPLNPSFVEHVVYGATFHSKKASLAIEKRSPAAYVINRALFDRHLASLAQDSGAKIRFSEALRHYEIEPQGVLVNGRYRAKILVGADGAGSVVRRLSGLAGEISFVNGIISTFDEPAKGRSVDIFYGKSIAPGFFAWIIPRGNTVEYGLASNKNHLGYFRKFLKSHGRKLSRFHSHPIVFGSQKTAGERVILLGDAALQVKPFSGGGVIYGLLCAKMASFAIMRAFRKNDFSKAFLEKNYDRAWKSLLSKPIARGKMLRKLLNSLDDDELDAFFELAKSKKGALESLGDMDFL